jgi:hypothetical protein
MHASVRCALIGTRLSALSKLNIRLSLQTSAVVEELERCPTNRREALHGVPDKKLTTRVINDIRSLARDLRPTSANHYDLPERWMSNTDNAESSSAVDCS